MIFKVQHEVGLQSPENRKTIHQQAGHVAIVQHFTNWKFKGRKLSNLPTHDMRNFDKIWAVRSRLIPNNQQPLDLVKL
jgi:hypothetical protein